MWEKKVGTEIQKSRNPPENLIYLIILNMSEDQPMVAVNASAGSATKTATSTVIRKPSNWADYAILLPHETFRDGLTRMMYTIDNWGEEAYWKIAAFQKVSSNCSYASKMSCLLCYEFSCFVLTGVNVVPCFYDLWPRKDLL